MKSAVLLTVCALVVTGSAAAITRPRSTAVNAASAACTPAITSYGSMYEQCFPPTAINDAEGEVPFHPVRPLSVVTEQSRLTLRQVLVLRQLEHSAGSMITDPVSQSPVVGVKYIFGSIPGQDDLVADVGPSEPGFVIVSEVAAPSGAVHSRLESLGPSSSADVRWSYSGYLESSGAELNIQSNVPPSVLRAIGDVLVGQAANVPGTPTPRQP